MFSCDYCEILKNTYFEKHLRTAAFEIEWKCFLIHEIGLIILNLLCKTYFKYILLSDCNNIVVIDQTVTNKRKMLDNISDCTKILLLKFTDQKAKVVYVINRGKISSGKHSNETRWL